MTQIVIATTALMIVSNATVATATASNVMDEEHPSIPAVRQVKNKLSGRVFIKNANVYSLFY